MKEEKWVFRRFLLISAELKDQKFRGYYYYFKFKEQKQTALGLRLYVPIQAQQIRNSLLVHLYVKVISHTALWCGKSKCWQCCSNMTWSSRTRTSETFLSFSPLCSATGKCLYEGGTSSQTGCRWNLKLIYQSQHSATLQ